MSTSPKYFALQWAYVAGSAHGNTDILEKKINFFSRDQLFEAYRACIINSHWATYLKFIERKNILKTPYFRSKNALLRVEIVSEIDG